MLPLHQIAFFALLFLAATPAAAQGVADTPTTEEEPPPFDASGYGDADAGAVKRYCSQKVSGQSPTKLIYAGFDYQGPADFRAHAHRFPDGRLRGAPGIRAYYSTPVVSRAAVIVNLAAQYSGTRFLAGDPAWWSSYNGLGDEWLHSLGLQATVFKPLNERHFLLFQASADHNIQGEEFDSRAITASALGLFGWKPSDRLMVGVGAARTYRLGAIIYVPVVYYYHTYNRRWGAEVVLPARAHLRYNLDKRSLLLAGYELEGQQYLLTEPRAVPFDGPFLRRGEVRPRIMYERSISGFFWLSVQAGARVNGRFSLSNDYSANGDRFSLRYDLSIAPYAQVGIALVSP